MFTPLSSQSVCKKLLASGGVSVSSSSATLANLNNTIISSNAITRPITSDNIIETLNTEESLSRSSSTLSIKQSVKDEVFSLSRSRINSFGEKVTYSATTTTHSTSCLDSILLTVHGLETPGPEIQDKLVEMMYKKLDEAVVESLCAVLHKVPQFKLPKEDVHFIQQPQRNPQISHKVRVSL